MNHRPLSPAAPTLGCVSFLNARPLIDGLDGRDDLRIRYDVPSRLLGDLLAGRADLALCPVIDFQTSERPLRIVPAGGIGCDGATLTVRLYSPVPMERVTRVHADTDSHSSVALMRIVLHDLYGVTPEVVDLRPGASPDGDGPARPAAAFPCGGTDAMLLIGDKVVTAAPPDERFGHQLDLGEAWKRLTGLPFLFAVWMARRGADLGTLPDLLDRQRRANAARIDRIADAHAHAAGWPADLARRYLGRLLRYRVGPRELRAAQRFWQRAHALQLIPRLRPLDLYKDAQSAEKTNDRECLTPND